MKGTGKKVAVFDSQFKLISVVSGISQLAKMMSWDSGSILRAIKGERLSCNSFYLRFVPDDMIIDMDEIGIVDLIEFDLDWLKEDRYVYATRNQKRSDIILESEMRIKRERKNI